MIHRLLAARVASGALALLVAGVLTGCSPDANARAGLSQSATAAASASRAVGLLLGQNENGQVLPTVLDTGLSDAADRLAAQAQNVVTMTAVGGIGASRARVLSDIRAAQDAVASAQKASAAGHDSGRALERERQELDRVAQQLAATSKRLEQQ